jgi:hypothetical protein
MVPFFSTAAVYPVKKSANGRYLVDQNDAPYLIVGDSPQALMVNISEAEAETFFANRSAYGFNSVWINLLCTTYTGGRPDAWPPPRRTMPLSRHPARRSSTLPPGGTLAGRA